MHDDDETIQEAIKAAGANVARAVFDGLEHTLGPCKASFSVACQIGEIASAIRELAEAIRERAD